jgi:hypothetical protein
VKLTAVPVTFACQRGFGHEKVAKNASEVVPVALISGISSLPFLVGKSGVEVVVVSDSVNGSIGSLGFLPGLLHVPVNVEVTAKVWVAFVFPTPWTAVGVQVTVVGPVKVHTGSPAPLAKCAPCGAFAKSTRASAGTAARAVTSSDSTAMMPIFLIKVFLLYLVGLYCLSLSTYKDVFPLSS